MNSRINCLEESMHDLWQTYHEVKKANAKLEQVGRDYDNISEDIRPWVDTVLDTRVKVDQIATAIAKLTNQLKFIASTCPVNLSKNED